MKGSARNPNVAQFKPCAITRVQVNYTPDGTYATYHDGAMVATELSINFLESKLIFTKQLLCIHQRRLCSVSKVILSVKVLLRMKRLAFHL